MKVRYTRQAESDLSAIGRFISGRNPAAAVTVANAIRSTIELLAAFPRLGRPRPASDVRGLVVPKYPYTVYYRIDASEVWVVHIRDNRRRPIDERGS